MSSVVEQTAGTRPLDGFPAEEAPQRAIRPRVGISRQMLAKAAWEAVGKLNPATLWHNPVIFMVEIGSTITTYYLIRALVAGAPGVGFLIGVALWLWFTVLFANFAEALAESRGKAQADTLRKTHRRTAGSSGMTKGAYKFKAVVPASPSFVTSTSATTVSIKLK